MTDPIPSDLDDLEDADDPDDLPGEVLGADDDDAAPADADPLPSR